jgi:hypothetical protein
MHFIQDEMNIIHLTQTNYEKSLGSKQHNLDKNMSPLGLSSSQYRLFVDVFQDELHNKYDLRARPSIVNKTITPNVFLPLSQAKDKKNEATICTKKVDNQEQVKLDNE